MTFLVYFKGFETDSSKYRIKVFKIAQKRSLELAFNYMVNNFNDTKKKFQDIFQPIYTNLQQQLKSN